MYKESEIDCNNFNNGSFYQNYYHILMQNLTEFNTAHNKRVAGAAFEETLQSPEAARQSRKRKTTRVTFHEEDEVINPGSYNGQSMYTQASMVFDGLPKTCPIASPPLAQLVAKGLGSQQ